MEPLGSHYAVLLNDPQLREGLAQAAGRSSRWDIWSSFALQLRARLAATLHQLAARVEPTVTAWSASRPSQSATLE
jgi:hypothetical protein